MLNKLFPNLYPKVFINIMVGLNSINIYIEVVSNKKIKKSIEKSFDTLTIDKKVESFIEEYLKESPYYYITLLDKSSSQGAIPICTQSKMKDFCDIETSIYKCFNNEWAYYTSVYELEKTKLEYKKIGIDFIFSPFVILAKFFKDRIDSSAAMFILMEENFVTLAIFRNSKLLYADHIDLEYQKDQKLNISNSLISQDDDSMDIGGGIDIENIAMDTSSDGFGDLASIEELDINDGFDDFSQNGGDSSLNIQDERHSIKDEVINNNYERFLLIQNSLNTFYKDKKYNSEFIETLFVADTIGLESDFKSYIEDEMFLSVHIRKMHLPSMLCDTAKAELNEI